MNSYCKLIDNLISISADINSYDTTYYEDYGLIPDEVNNIFWRKFHVNLNNKYTCINDVKHQEVENIDLNEDHWKEIIKLISWVIRMLKDFSLDYVKNNKSLVILNIIYFLDNNDKCFWNSLFHHKIFPNDKFYKYIKKELFFINKNSPYEIDIPNKLKRAISEKNWFDISINLQCKNANPINSSINQMIVYSEIFQRNALLEVLEECHDIFILKSVMEILNIETAFRLGANTHNEYLEFSAVYFSIIMNSYHDEDNFSADENDYLSEIFIKVANDNKKLKIWMSIFNKYPCCYPKIQYALGTMLAKTQNIDSIKTYIYSIHLIVDGYDEYISNCLKTFYELSNPNRRKELWKIAYSHWKKWDFVKNPRGNELYNISFSGLDVAIVGYYKDCLTSEERDKEKEGIVNTLCCINNIWHRSITDIHTKWYKYVSILQLIEHAEKVKNYDDIFLPVTSIYIPKKLSNKKYMDSLGFKFK